MRYAKTLVLAGLAVAAMMVFVGTAAASTLTQAPPVTGTVKAESANFVIDGSIKIECKKSALEWNVESHGAGVATKGPLSKFTLEECNRTMTVTNPGSLELHATSGGNGTMTWSGARLTVQTTVLGFPVHCIYATSNTDIGTFTGSTTTKATATLDIGSVLLPQEATSEACGNDAVLTGSYKFTSPDYLVVE